MSDIKTDKRNIFLENFSLSDKYILVILLSIIVLSFVLRIYMLDSENLWVDEIFSIHIADNNLIKIIEASAKDMHPPLYYIILHYWSELFGNSEFITRIPSVIAGILSICVMYMLGKLMFNKEVGILSTFILSISLFHIRYSQEARSYIFMVLFVLLSNYYFIKIIKERSEIKNLTGIKDKKDINKKNIIGYIVFTVATLYIHFYGIFYVIVQNIYYLLINRKDIRKDIKIIKFWAILQVAILLLFSIWIPFLLRQVTRTVTNGKIIIDVPTINTLYQTFETFADSNIGLYLFIIIGIIYIVRLYRQKNQKENKNESKNGCESNNIIFLLLWLLMPIIISVIISYAILPIYVDRYVIASLPAFILLLSVIIFSFRKIAIISIILVIFTVPTVLSLEQYYEKPQKEQWIKAIGYINGNQKDGDFIMVFPAFRGMPFEYYYKGTNFKLTNYEKNNRPEINSLIKGHKRIWVVNTIIRKGLKDELKELEGMLSKNYIRDNDTVKFSKLRINLYTIR